MVHNGSSISCSGITGVASISILYELDGFRLVLLLYKSEAKVIVLNRFSGHYVILFPTVCRFAHGIDAG